MVSSLLEARPKAGTATPGEMVTAARTGEADAQSQAAVTAGSVAETAGRASDVATQKAQEATAAATEGADNARGNSQEAPGTAVDRVEQTAEPAAGTAPEAAETAPSVTAEPIGSATAVAPEHARPPAGVTTEAAAGSTALSSVHTDVDAPPPLVYETMQAGLADIDDRVRDLSAQVAPEPTEQGAVRSRDAATFGALGDHAKVVGAADVVTDAGGRREDGATEVGITPEEQRAHAGVGTGTTAPTGGPVDPLSSVGTAPTASGVPELLPTELTPGEPGTGSPAGSSRGPSRTDRSETPTTGMEQPPVVDRAAAAAGRTSGQFVGNTSTRVYHPATSGDLPSERHRVYFETEQEAMAAGFRPARHEGPPGGGASRPHTGHEGPPGGGTRRPHR